LNASQHEYYRCEMDKKKRYIQDGSSAASPLSKKKKRPSPGRSFKHPATQRAPRAELRGCWCVDTLFLCTYIPVQIPQPVQAIIINNTLYRNNRHPSRSLTRSRYDEMKDITTPLRYSKRSTERAFPTALQPNTIRRFTGRRPHSSQHRGGRGTGCRGRRGQPHQYQRPHQRQ
jgi:hypothetical protein